MSTVTVSTKFQVVIPKEVRESMKLRPGEKLEVFPWGSGTGIEMVRVRPMKQMRGFVKGIDSRVERDADRV